MLNKDKLDNDKLLKVSQKIGYNQNKYNDLEDYTAQIFKMDLWDISKAHFFGPTWEKY